MYWKLIQYDSGKKIRKKKVTKLHELKLANKEATWYEWSRVVFQNGQVTVVGLGLLADT